MSFRKFLNPIRLNKTPKVVSEIAIVSLLLSKSPEESAKPRVPIVVIIRPTAKVLEPLRCAVSVFDSFSARDDLVTPEVLEFPAAVPLFLK